MTGEETKKRKAADTEIDTQSLQRRRTTPDQLEDELYRIYDQPYPTDWDREQAVRGQLDCFLKSKLIFGSVLDDPDHPASKFEQAANAFARTGERALQTLKEFYEQDEQRYKKLRFAAQFSRTFSKSGQMDFVEKVYRPMFLAIIDGSKYFSSEMSDVITEVTTRLDDFNTEAKDKFVNYTLAIADFQLIGENLGMYCNLLAMKSNGHVSEKNLPAYNRRCQPVRRDTLNGQAGHSDLKELADTVRLRRAFFGIAKDRFEEGAIPKAINPVLPLERAYKQAWEDFGIAASSHAKARSHNYGLRDRSSSFTI